jgi:hypothetical protein
MLTERPLEGLFGGRETAKVQVDYLPNQTEYTWRNDNLYETLLPVRLRPIQMEHGE